MDMKTVVAALEALPRIAAAFESVAATLRAAAPHAAPNPVPEAEKPKPAEPPKPDKPKADKPKVEEKHKPAESPKPAEPPKPTGPSEFEVLKTLVLTVTKDVGRDAAVAILKAHGAAKLSELSEDKYDVVKDALQKALDAGEAPV